MARFEIEELRDEINKIDEKLVDLFCRRMKVSEEIAQYKKEKGLPIFDAHREQEVIRKVTELSGEYGKYAAELYREMMALSKQRQKEVHSKYGLIGETLGHSFSKEIHESLDAKAYRLMEVKREELEDFFKTTSFQAMNVTIPYKKEAMKFCTALSEQAKEIGSVNTIVKNKEGGCTGYNTDYDGFCYLVNRKHIDFTDKKVVILGDGGASLTVQYAAKKLGAKNVVVVSRKGIVTYEQINQYKDGQIIINTTPVGMFPQVEQTLVDLKIFHQPEAVIDLIYHPRRTNLLQQAEELGITTADGLAMLVAQAIKAEELFFNKTYETKVYEEVLSQIATKTRNLVLVGMPGSGKSTLGKILGAISNRSVIDVDEEIVRRTGKNIPEFFAEFGEQKFRTLEQELIAEFSLMKGIILVTGGGAVTTPNNKKFLKYNGYVYYIERNVEQLGREGRPISQSRNIYELYRERKPLYQDFSDTTMKNEGNPEEIAGQIWKHFQNLECNT